jgi:hypothetical protein
MDLISNTAECSKTILLGALDGGRIFEAKPQAREVGSRGAERRRCRRWPLGRLAVGMSTHSRGGIQSPKKTMLRIG